MGLFGRNTKPHVPPGRSVRRSTYPAASDAAGRLLVELDSEQFGGWGDAGIGHIFGNPRAVSTGDVSSVRYHWDCF